MWLVEGPWDPEEGELTWAQHEGLEGRKGFRPEEMGGCRVSEGCSIIKTQGPGSRNMLGEQVPWPNLSSSQRQQFVG